MSLINDVLNDINSRSADDRRNFVAEAMPLHSFSDHKKHHFLMLSSIAVFLVAVVAVIFELSKQASDEGIKKKQLEVISTPTNETVSDSADIYTADNQSASKVKPQVTEQKIEEYLLEISTDVDTPLAQRLSQQGKIAKKSNRSVKKEQISKHVAEPAAQPELNKKVVISKDGALNYNRALAFYNNGKYQQAINQLEQAITIASKEKYQVLLMRSQLKQGDLAGFEKSVATNKYTGFDTFSTIASGFYMLQQYQQAIPYFEKTVKSRPSIIQWQIAQALNFESAGQYQQADDIYQRLLAQGRLNTFQKRQLEIKHEIILTKLAEQSKNNGS